MSTMMAETRRAVSRAAVTTAVCGCCAVRIEPVQVEEDTTVWMHVVPGQEPYWFCRATVAHP